MFDRQSCRNDEDRNGALCYPKCRPGYRAVGCCLCEPDGGPGIKVTLGQRQYCNPDEEMIAGLCYKKPRAGFSCKATICDFSKENTLTLRSVNNGLQNVHIACCEYKDIYELVEKGDFVYMDPPYHETFTDYTNNKFAEEEQQQLKLFVDKLNEKGVYIMLSNSATNFIKDLYKDYKQINLMIN